MLFSQFKLLVVSKWIQYSFEEFWCFQASDNDCQRIPVYPAFLISDWTEILVMTYKLLCSQFYEMGNLSRTNDVFTHSRMLKYV